MTPETKHRHREAFCLMWYACEQCGARERIWNSRDGVTPFGMGCPHCGADGLRGMKHVDWNLDEYAPNHTPPPGQRIWVSMTYEQAEAYTDRRLDAILASRDLDHSEIEEYRLAIFNSIYHDGEAPDLTIAGYVRSDA